MSKDTHTTMCVKERKNWLKGWLSQHNYTQSPVFVVFVSLHAQGLLPLRLLLPINPVIFQTTFIDRRTLVFCDKSVDLGLAKKANWTLRVGNARKEITKENGTLGHEQANLMLFVVDIPSSSLPKTCTEFLLLVEEGDGFCMILTLKGIWDIKQRSHTQNPNHTLLYNIYKYKWMLSMVPAAVPASPAWCRRARCGRRSRTCFCRPARGWRRRSSAAVPGRRTGCRPLVSCCCCSPPQSPPRSRYPEIHPMLLWHWAPGWSVAT